ncbi:skeletal aspartic acid-rich protein 2 [Nematostella vectensis]|uniref:skeletal aspartic acid-rich protein 2 n=1 Tax=Nematostella vectensis TaxID=45351 RepID=UPI002077372B|nr:skeletal aspartic acid-rich protein 2 [Nematostella vectensis]
MGKSGKISIYFKGQSKEDGLTFKFEDLGERDSNGNTVGQAGSEKHNFNTFAQLDFQFSEVVQDKFQNISVYTFNMTSYISSVKANFMSQVYIFAENGSYVWGDEETEVRKGSVKFNIKVEGWKFCGDPGYTCKEGVGSYLDSKICIASKKGSGRKMERKQNKAGERPKGPKGKAKAEKFFFAGDSIVMPRGVEVDGTGKDMPAGYPSVDSSNCFTVRFPKFNSYALYDPSVTLDDNEAPPSSGATPLKWSLALALVALLAAWLQ